MVPPEYAARNERSIIFLGHIHTMNTPMIAEIASLWAVAYLQGKLEIPNLPAMEAEVARWNAWTRRRYLGQGEKTPYAMYDSVHVSGYGIALCTSRADMTDATQYTDLLLNDLGLSPFRKQTWVTEIFTPYKPADLSGCVQEWMKSLRTNRPKTEGGGGDGFYGTKNWGVIGLVLAWYSVV